MENKPDIKYRDITDLHFAVWNMIKPVNFIWVDINDCCVKCGVKDQTTDTVADQRQFEEQQKNAFVELIAYDDDGNPMLGFDEPIKKQKYPYSVYKATPEELEAFLGDMEEIELLNWRNSFPSLNEGLCWRIDVYAKTGEKHMSGQARFPKAWSAFGKSLNALVQRVETRGAEKNDNSK